MGITSGGILTMQGLIGLILTGVVFWVKKNIEDNFSSKLEEQKNQLYQELEQVKTGLSIVGEEIKDKLAIYKGIRDSLSDVSASTDILFDEVNDVNYKNFIRDYKKAYSAVQKGKFLKNDSFMSQAKKALEALKKYKCGKWVLVNEITYLMKGDVKRISDDNEIELAIFNHAFDLIAEAYKEREEGYLLMEDFLSK